MSFRSISFGALISTFLAVGALASAAEETTHDGSLVNITSGKLVMANNGKGSKQHTHILANDVKMTLDGQPCRAEDLKAGTRIRVTLDSNGKKAATNIEAIDKDELFANMHSGRIVSITSKWLVMRNKNGEKEHSHSISKDAKVIRDGQVCKASDLRTGMRVRVTTKKSDGGVAIGIEAIDKQVEFERSN